MDKRKTKKRVPRLSKGTLPTDKGIIPKYRRTKRKKRALASREPIPDYDYLYPILDDPNFNIKITKKKEFGDHTYLGKHTKDIAFEADRLCNASFELAPHQMFVRNFMSQHTPYNGLLLYHGLGSGKTCAAIGIAEETRDYLKQTGDSRQSIIVASPNVQENFRLQLFDPRKLDYVDGAWNINSCTGNKMIREIDPMGTRDMSRDRVIAYINRIISSSYLFMGYRGFANYIDKKMDVDASLDANKRDRILKSKMKKHFTGRLIIIDEIHNIRVSDMDHDKRVASSLSRLVDYAGTMKLVFLSATPMYNSYTEIIWLLNLLNRNDSREQIEVGDVFKSDGTFIMDEDGMEVGKELLMRKATGYVSFVRGENPYTFPYRIWPREFDETMEINSDNYPSIQPFNSKIIRQPIETISLYKSPIGKYQEKGYDMIIESLLSGDMFTAKRDGSVFDDMDAFGYITLQRPLEALNIVYPHPDLGEDLDPKYLVGSGGLDRIMRYTEKNDPPDRYDYVYKDEKYGRMFAPNEIGKYSGKIETICKNIMGSQGVILIYSKYIDGGIIPMSLALEELGFTRANRKPLFKTAPTEPIDAFSMKPRKATKGEFSPAKYVMITGDKGLSSDNIEDIKSATNPSNKDGKDVRVILISAAGSEGIDLSFIRQVHIMDPWYNMNRIEQILGRAIRTCSHKLLEFKKRNVELYLYGTILSDTDIESVDLYIYRVAERKALQTGRVSRILKKGAVDCILNMEQFGFNVKDMDVIVEQELSSGNTIEYQVGDRPFSSTCDYMEECNYQCEPDVTVDEYELSLDTYHESFAKMNLDKLLHRIRSLFKESFFYRRDKLISSIVSTRNYSTLEIDTALSRLIEDKSEYIVDNYGRRGRLVNIGDIYLFKPMELLDVDPLSYHNIVTPIDHKHSRLGVKVSEVIPKVARETSGDHMKIVDAMREKYDKSFSDSEILRGENDWYIFSSKIIKLMRERLKMSAAMAKNIIVQNIVDNLSFNETMMLLNSVETWEGEFMKMVKAYMDQNMVYNKKLKLAGMLLQRKGEHVLVCKGVSDDNWREAEYSDVEELSVELGNLSKSFFPLLEKTNKMIGLMTAINTTSDARTFKIKSMDNHRRKGSRCDQSPKKDNIEIIHKISPDFDDDVDALNKQELCVIQELLFRFFNLTKRDKKIWFVNPGIFSFIEINKN